jgi:hypothetical protein
MTVAFISGLLICRSCNKPQIQTISHNDTIVVLKARVDTLEVERIKTKTIYEKSIDTIYLYDSVAIDSAYTKAINRLQQLERVGFFKP